jgi:hypothetical protein
MVNGSRSSRLARTNRPPPLRPIGTPMSARVNVATGEHLGFTFLAGRRRRCCSPGCREVWSAGSTPRAASLPPMLGQNSAPCVAGRLGSSTVGRAFPFAPVAGTLSWRDDTTMSNTAVARFIRWNTNPSTVACIGMFRASGQLLALRAARRIGLNISGGRFNSPGMPNVSGRALRFAFFCFPHASPVLSTRVGKQKTAPKDRFKHLIFLKNFGAGEGARPGQELRQFGRYRRFWLGNT